MVLLRIKFIVFLVILVLGFYSAEQAFSQYSSPEIQYAISKLREWKLLDQLTQLTEQNSQAAATRADLLITCYQIVRELKRLDVDELQNGLNRLQTSVTRMESISSSTPSNVPSFTNENELIRRILNLVEENLKTMEPVQKLENDAIDLNKKLYALKRYLDRSNVREVAQLKKKITYNTIIASASVIVSLALSILAAR